MTDINNSTPEPTEATEKIAETLKEVSSGPEATDVVEKPVEDEDGEDSGVVNEGSVPFPTDGAVVSTIEGVDSDADDFIESPTGEEQTIEASPESDQYVASEDDE